MENKMNYSLWYREVVFKDYRLKLIELEKQKKMLDFDIERCKESIEYWGKAVEEAKGE